VADVLLRQQVKDAAQAAVRAEAALRQQGQAPAVLGALAEPGRLAVNIERQGNGHVRAVGPGREVCW
jgi:hypothetical protein